MQKCGCCAHRREGGRISLFHSSEVHQLVLQICLILSKSTGQVQPSLIVPLPRGSLGTVVLCVGHMIGHVFSADPLRTQPYIQRSSTNAATVHSQGKRTNVPLTWRRLCDCSIHSVDTVASALDSWIGLSPKQHVTWILAEALTQVSLKVISIFADLLPPSQNKSKEQRGLHLYGDMGRQAGPNNVISGLGSSYLHSI